MDHVPYSKRAMAGDIAALMRRLGHDTFAVVGHDRGAYVAHRLVLDAADRVDRLVVLDAVPIGAALARADTRFATAWWHWFFLGQTHQPAERVINADPDAWYAAAAPRRPRRWARRTTPTSAPPSTTRPSCAMCEDYRAGLGVDRTLDDADQAAGRRVTCPTLLLWSSRDDLADLYGDPLAVWRDWAEILDGGPIASGHHVAEENPAALVAALRSFLTR